MPKGKLLTDYEKVQIAAYRSLGLSNRKVSVKIRRSSTCIVYFVKEQNSPTTKKMAARKNKLNPQTKSLIIRESSKTRASIAKIKDQLKLGVRRETIGRVLKTSPNLNYEKFSRKSPINALNKAIRLMFG